MHKQEVEEKLKLTAGPSSYESNTSYLYTLLDTLMALAAAGLQFWWGLSGMEEERWSGKSVQNLQLN